MKVPGHTPSVRLDPVEHARLQTSGEILAGADLDREEVWRGHCTCGITSYPGTRREAGSAVGQHMTERAHAIGLAD